MIAQDEIIKKKRFPIYLVLAFIIIFFIQGPGIGQKSSPSVPVFDHNFEINKKNNFTITVNIIYSKDRNKNYYDIGVRLLPVNESEFKKFYPKGFDVELGPRFKSRAAWTATRLNSSIIPKIRLIWTKIGSDMRDEKNPHGEVPIEMPTKTNNGGD